jgi:hypothetical protein
MCVQLRIIPHNNAPYYNKYHLKNINVITRSAVLYNTCATNQIVESHQFLLIDQSMPRKFRRGLLLETAGGLQLGCKLTGYA